MDRPWLDDELPVEHRRAHAHEWLGAMNELLAGEAWPRLEELLSSWIEERRDHLERGADAGDSDEYHRGFIACARAILSEPEEAAAAASSYIDNHHQEHLHE